MLDEPEDRPGKPPKSPKATTGPETQNTGNNEPEKRIVENLVKLPDRVSFYSLSSFLKDPFQFRVGQMLMAEEDEDVEKESFEPVFFNNIDTSSVLKKLVAAELSCDDSAEKQELEKLQKELKLSGKMPDGIFGEKQNQLLNAKAQLILDQMKDNKLNFGELSFGAKIQDMIMARSDGTHWLLSGKLDWCDAPQGNPEKATRIVEITSSDKANKEIPYDKYMPPYIKALALIAYKGEKNPAFADELQTIDVSIYSCDPAKKGPADTSVAFTPNEAKKKLEEIYAKAFGEVLVSGNAKKTVVLPYSKAVPAEKLDWPKNNDDKDIYAFKGKLMEKYGAWSYFDKKSLFDPVTDVGFTAENFETEWETAKSFMYGLIKIPKYPVKTAAPKEETSSDDNVAPKKGSRKKKAEK
jgi:exodeoxyribonuclease V gamma subunit